ncbi:hypothetical protein HRbin36_01269 [bacterium HR36]|nr:hypothetical protein HRbin36_01269 [bacterium HR36]
MVTLERLSITFFVAAAGSVAHMAYDRRPSILLHERFELSAMIQTQCFDDRTDVFVRIEQFLAVRIERGNASSQLTAILQIQQKSRHQTNNLLPATSGSKVTALGPIQVVKRCDAALVLSLVHKLFPGRLALGRGNYMHRRLPFRTSSG